MIEPYIETRTGRKVHFLNPQDDAFLIEDIAFSLANQCRFNGHCERFYSVAEHSVLVSSLVDPEFKLEALLHDASEAYLSDIPSPVKQFMPEYAKLEETVMAAIRRKFGLPEQESADVKKADRQQLCSEAYALLPSQGKGWSILEGFDYREGRKPMCFPPQHAFGVFMAAFQSLTEKKETPKLIMAAS